MSPADVAVENVELLIAGTLTDPSPGTLAARVLAWAEKFNPCKDRCQFDGIDVTKDY